MQLFCQYPLFQKKHQHITETPKKFIKDKFNLDVTEDPEIQINHELISLSSKKFQINKDDVNILLGIGGSGPTKRIPAKTFINVIKMMSEKKKCKFFLATGKNNDEQLILNEILKSKYKDLCVPLDNLSIKETLPIIKNCNLKLLLELHDLLIHQWKLKFFYSFNKFFFLLNLKLYLTKSKYLLLRIHHNL